MKRALLVTFTLAVASLALAKEGMWRLEQLSTDRLDRGSGVRGVSIRESDIPRLRQAPVRILAGGSGGTGSFASPNGLILTNHHVALDCIRTSTLAEHSDNYVQNGFTAPSMTEELPCRRFIVQIERESSDVTVDMDAAVTPGMDAVEIQQARERKRSEIERNCQQQRGDNYSCDVVDFNSGERSLLIVYEELKDIRLVYAPEVQLGYFGGDEMNFRFPRYVSDISILRAYVAPGGAHTEYDAANVPYRPEHYFRVSFDGIEEEDVTLVMGFPGNTNRYRMSYSADYNLRRGIPKRIEDIETELELLRGYASQSDEYDVLLKNQIFGLANTLKYQRDVLEALKTNDVVSRFREREREFMQFLDGRPELRASFGSILDDQARVYAEDVEANDALDSAISWLSRSSVLGYASGLYQFALARAESSDAEREPQFQERNWPRVRQGLSNEDPIILKLDEDYLTRGFELALALAPEQRIAAVEELRQRVGDDPRRLAAAVLEGTEIRAVATRERLLAASVDEIAASEDPAIAFARALEPTLKARRQRVRVLNEKLFMNRARFSRGMVAWKGDDLYYDANFTLRATFGQAKSYFNRAGEKVSLATRFEGLFRLAEERGNTGEFALPKALSDWKQSIGDPAFRERYADMPVNFVTTNDTTGGNSGSAILDAQLRVVGLLFDGNEDSMASDWIYSETTGRAIATDIRFALTVARDVHRAGWIVDELRK
jgi:hypothetical protein